MNQYVKVSFGAFLHKLSLFITKPKMLLDRIEYSFKRMQTDRRAAKGDFSYPQRIIFIAGMPKSGTSWLENMILRIPGYCSRQLTMPFNIHYNHGIIDEAFSKFPKTGYSFVKTHINPSEEHYDCLKRNGVNKIVVTYRDLRDVAISRYYHLLAFPKSKHMDDFVDYHTIGKEKAIADSLKVIKEYYQPWAEGWISLAEKYPDEFLIIRYEELRQDTPALFKRFLKFYEIDLPDEKVVEIIEAARGKGNLKVNLEKGVVLPSGLHSTFRKGKVGGWRDELSPENMKLAKELLGECLIKLKYEQDLNWGAELCQKS